MLAAALPSFDYGFFSGITSGLGGLGFFSFFAFPSFSSSFSFLTSSIFFSSSFPVFPPFANFSGSTYLESEDIALVFPSGIEIISNFLLAISPSIL